MSHDTPCSICPQAPHPQATHCRECHASWNRQTNTAHCSVCHRTFSTPGVFDKHLLSRGCTDPAEVTRRNGDKVYGEPRDNTWGTPVWRLPADESRWS